MCLSNFKAMQQFKASISWLRDFTRSYEKTSFHILRRGPISMYSCSTVHNIFIVMIHWGCYFNCYDTLQLLFFVMIHCSCCFLLWYTVAAVFLLWCTVTAVFFCYDTLWLLFFVMIHCGCCLFCYDSLWLLFLLWCTVTAVFLLWLLFSPQFCHCKYMMVLLKKTYTISYDI